MRHRGRKSRAEIEADALYNRLFPEPRPSVASGPPYVPPEPPRDLEAPEAEIWRDFVRDYQVPPGPYHVLHSGLQMLRRARKAQEIIAKEGMCVPNRDGNPRPHPAIKIEKRLSALFCLDVASIEGWKSYVT